MKAVIFLGAVGSILYFSKCQIMNKYHEWTKGTDGRKYDVQIPKSVNKQDIVEV